MYSVGSSKTNHIPQPEIQLLKETGEAILWASPAFSLDAGQTGQASPLFLYH